MRKNSHDNPKTNKYMKQQLTKQMRNSFLATLLLILAQFSSSLQAQNVGIGITTPDASALLHVNSTSKGMLIPRMTTAQKNILVSPANGLIIFQTDSVQGLYYNSGTSITPVWERMVTSKSAWNLGGNAGTTPATHFIGTTDNNGLRFKVNNINAGLITANNDILR